WEWFGSNDKTVVFDPAIPDGVVVQLVRRTALDAPLHQFSLGAAFLAGSVDENFAQMLRIAQEAVEQTGQAAIDIAEGAVATAEQAVLSADLANSTAAAASANAAQAVTTANAAQVAADAA